MERGPNTFSARVPYPRTVTCFWDRLIIFTSISDMSHIFYVILKSKNELFGSLFGQI
jgi:hypothetical protein